MTEEQAFDEDDLRSLGEKLAGLDLTDRERAAMAALLADDDVGGFGARFDVIGGIRKGYVVTQDLQDWFTKDRPSSLPTSGRTSGVRHPDGTTGQSFKPGRF